MSMQQPFLGLISGQRRRSHAEVTVCVARIAGGLQKLGVKLGDSVCILMRNDIAFIERPMQRCGSGPMRCR
jgi:long-chain acyl-CoA synthetase